MVLLHEFDDNVAVVATSVASITTGIIVQFQAKLRQRRSLLQVTVRFAYRRGVSAATAAAVGVAQAPAGVFQLPSHR